MRAAPSVLPNREEADYKIFTFESNAELRLFVARNVFQFFRRAEIENPALFEELTILRNSKMCDALVAMLHVEGETRTIFWDQVEIELSEKLCADDRATSWPELSVISNFVAWTWFKFYEASRDFTKTCSKNMILLNKNDKKFHTMEEEIKLHSVKRKSTSISIEGSHTFLDNIIQIIDFVKKPKTV